MKTLTGLCMAATLTTTAGVSIEATAADYFKDDFSWGFNSAIWQPRNGANGTPFGCTFNEGAI